MNILIVDDLIAIAESLRNGIQWKKIGITDVFTANSVPEAKLLITNFEIDILLTDIEMPGEDGLDLVQWINESGYNICSIFLTSHADFSYAQRAVKLGGFDYIMQPVRYLDVEQTVSRAIEEVNKCKKYNTLEKAWNQLLDRRGIFLDALLRQFRNKDYYAAELIMSQLLSVLNFNKDEVLMHAIRMITDSVENIRHKDMSQQTLMVLHVLEEKFNKSKFTICISHSYSSGFYILLICNKDSYDAGRFRQSIFSTFSSMSEQWDTSCVFCVSAPVGATDKNELKTLEFTFTKTRTLFEQENCHIIWDDEIEEEDNAEYKSAVVEKAIDYIQAHIGKNITRTEVAALVCLSEEYFSRVFKQYSGWNFKEYVLNEKMKVAKSLLLNSDLPISLIAAKLGFNNFSHFSKTFKKITDSTPQEYRKASEMK